MINFTTSKVLRQKTGDIIDFELMANHISCKVELLC